MKYFYECQSCFEPAFFIDHLPVTGELLTAEGVTLTDGSKPLSGSKPQCGHCKTGLTLKTKHIKENPDAA